MPLHNELGDYHAPISHMIDGFKRADPPSEKKLAVGVEVPEMSCPLVIGSLESSPECSRLPR